MAPASRRQIVLASGSPRRRELATAEGWDVLVVPPPEAIEAMAAPRATDESLEAYVLRLARAKGQAVADLGIDGTIIACDTLSEVDGIALGKPADRDDARHADATFWPRASRSDRSLDIQPSDLVAVRQCLSGHAGGR
jgi:septum formation protein